MKKIYDATPDRKRDSLMLININHKILNSLIRLIEHCEKTINVNFGELVELINSLKDVKKLKPSIHAIYYLLKNNVKQNNTNSILKILNFLNHNKDFISSGKKTSIDKFKNWEIEYTESYFIDKASRHTFFDTYGKSFGLTTPTIGGFKKSLDYAKKSLSVLKELDIEYYKEINDIICNIVICDTHKMNAATSFYTFGNIYIREIRKNEDWTRMLEHIVHEAGHHHLYAVFTEDPLFDSKVSGVFNSPLRKSQRPLSGIYHAMFVIARTLRVLNKMKKSNKYHEIASNIKTSYNEKGNEDDFIVKFEEVYKIIKENAKLTEVGKKLLESSREMAYA